MKTVAVLLVNYNGINDTIECINSLLKSQTAANIRIVIVDNASKNDEAGTLEKLYPDVHIIKSKENLGFGGGNNLGIKYLMDQDIDYILMLNNDTIVAEDMIDKLISADNGRCVCLPKMYYYDYPETIWYGGGYINKATGNAKHFQMNCIDKNSKDETVMSCTFACFTCVLIRKDIIKDVGLFDEDYFIYCDDTDYSLRLLENSINILYIPSAHLWHKVSKSSGGLGSAASEYYITRNRFIYLKAHKKYFAFSAFTFSLISRYIRIAQYAVLGRKNWRSIYKGIKDYFKGVRGRVDKYE